MKIGQKLVLSFLGIALLIGILGYITVDISQRILQESIGENSVLLVEETLDKIDRHIHERLEEFQAYSKDILLQEAVTKSNREFEKLANIQEYIIQKDKEWTSVPKDEMTPFMQELINTKLAEEIREKTKFYEHKYGYKIFGEVFATNKYGANVTQTGKTTDYYQADEEWWQKAKEEELYIADVEYDKSANVYSTDIGIAINDEKGFFLGVIKVILNIEEAINIIKELEPERSGGYRASGSTKYETMHFKLLTKNGKVIYATKEFQLLQDMSKEDFFEKTKEKEGNGFFIAYEEDEGEVLFAYARSKGYKDYKGLGWILIVEYEAKEIFAPVTNLRNALLIISVAVMILAVLIGLFISFSISNPIVKLKDATTKIAAGNLAVKIDIKSKDEIGDLVTSFNRMAEDLKRLVEKEKELAAVTAARETESKRAAELEKAYKDLQEAQDMLIQAEKLNAVGQLASGVAHEVRNPLGIIIQGVNYLEKKISPKKKDTFETLAMLKNSVRRADKIINSLLDFSRATKLDLQPEDINSALESSLNLIKTKIKFKNIEVIKETKKDIPKILIDRNRIEQVFVNVFLNAIQAMPGGGKIIIRSYDKQLEEAKNGIGKRAEDHFRLGEKAVIVEIEDTGKGISEKNLKKIFDPFFTTKSPNGGAGLGLSVSRNIIIMHKALIDVKSQIGKGTKVTVILKIARRG